ncbi:MAG: hypothetical protein QXO67_04975 [Candidatus Bathyarchaeia archaeon]
MERSFSTTSKGDAPSLQNHIVKYVFTPVTALDRREEAKLTVSTPSGKRR